MSRRSIDDYSGAVGRLELERVRSLGGRFAVQPKIDGAYVHVYLDGRGRIERVRYRTGVDVTPNLVGHLFGAFVGWPGSVLAGELEVQSEAGNASATARGYRLVHLFDCIRAGDRYLARDPYQSRRDTLWRMQSEVANLMPPVPYERDSGLRGRDRASGQYVRATPTDYRLTPIVPQLPVQRASELWDEVEAGQLEGLVVVALDAPLGRRNAKRKVKPTDTIDCDVVHVERAYVRLRYQGRTFAVVRGRHELEVGDIVAVAHDGWYGSAEPKFARIAYRRGDLLA